MSNIRLMQGLPEHPSARRELFIRPCSFSRLRSWPDQAIEERVHGARLHGADLEGAARRCGSHARRDYSVREDSSLSSPSRAAGRDARKIPGAREILASKATYSEAYRAGIEPPGPLEQRIGPGGRSEGKREIEAIHPPDVFAEHAQERRPRCGSDLLGLGPRSMWIACPRM